MSSDIDLVIDLESAFEELTSDNPAIVRLWASGYTLAEIGTRFGLNKSNICRRIDSSISILRRGING